MNSGAILVRPTRPEEYRQTEELVRESFWDVYRPGCWEHALLHALREQADYISALDLVAEKDGALIGQNIFFPAAIQTDDGRSLPLLTMGPLGIVPAHQRQGYGKQLLSASLRCAAEQGFGAVCIEGDISFYGTCGFRTAADFGLRYHGLPADADASFFLCCELIPGYLSGISGEYATPAAYLIDEATVDSFDRSFPPKEKHKLPTQLF